MVAAGLTLALVSSGCTLHRLSLDADAARHIGLISGRVTAGGTGPTYVVHFIEERGALRVDEVVRLDGRLAHYGFFVDTEHRHRVAAFQDTNDDRAWQPGEPIGALPNDEAVVVSPRSQQSLPDIELRPASEPLPRMELDLRAGPSERRRLLAAGQVTTLDNPTFSPEAGSAGMWTPLTSAREHGFGVYFLQEYDPRKIPVLFVHGMGGTPREFRSFIGALDPRRYQAWVVRYPSGIRLRLCARVLRDVLVGLHDRLHFDRMVIVAHSMGGLVARGALQELARDDSAGFVSDLVTMSTPYGGHGGAATGVSYLRDPVPSWVDLSPGSEFLHALETPLPSSLNFQLIFTVGRQRTVLRSPDNNDGVVDVASELAAYAQRDADRLHGFDVDHEHVLLAPAVLQGFTRLMNGSGEPRCARLQPPPPR